MAVKRDEDGEEDFYSAMARMIFRVMQINVVLMIGVILLALTMFLARF